MMDVGAGQLCGGAAPTAATAIGRGHSQPAWTCSRRARPSSGPAVSSPKTSSGTAGGRQRARSHGSRDARTGCQHEEGPVSPEKMDVSGLSKDQFSAIAAPLGAERASPVPAARWHADSLRTAWRHVRELPAGGRMASTAIGCDSGGRRRVLSVGAEACKMIEASPELTDRIEAA